MRRVTGFLLASIVFAFAPSVKCAEQGTNAQTYEQLSAERDVLFRTAECPTENCGLAIGPDDLPLGALLTYQKCADDVRKSYVFRRGEDSWEMVRYSAEQATGCPELPAPSRP